MAYAAVASLSHTIDLLLNYHHDSISPQFKDQITSLHKHIIFLQSFLEDAPDRAKNWEETISEVTETAEEIVELLLSDSLLEYELDYGFDELEGVTQEIESIANRLKGGRRIEAMGGSDDELMEIISRLRGGSSSEVQIISIVGMGGMGKTTLARNAYNHPLIVEHFDVRSWSTISTDYNWMQIIFDLLRSMKAEIFSNSQSELIKSLHKNLDGKRYLIVLDDIWSLEILDWLQIMLPYNGNGSRIILTTTSFELAKSADCHIHTMDFLDEEKTWNVLREKIFKGDPCPSQLECIGKMIAGSCRGHPLAIEVVSGILAAADQTEADWEDISEDIEIASDQTEVSDGLYLVLTLGYTYLPHHLRPCFVYLACFPEDHEIHVSKLVRLWVAEGFLNESECKSYEEIGEELVENLVRRNLVSVSKRKSNGRIKCITIHYVMRDFCQIQARIDNFCLHVSRFYSFDQQAMEIQLCRRVSNFSYGSDFLGGVYGSTIRTIMLYLDDYQLGIRWPIGNVRLLRILDLSNAYNYDLAEEVFELFHLRYLAFHCRFSLSEAISNLENLQTLIICPSENDGGMFDNLAEGIWRMPQLRHLFMFSFKLPSQKGATSALENLQTLSRVVDFICSRENLEMIPNLKKLALFYPKNLRDVVEDYELHNLIYLRKLEILKIEMDWSSFGEEHKMSTRCAFPPTLKKLNLCGVQLPWEDMKVVASLPNLEVLKLRRRAFVGETWETSEGGFCQLIFLEIEECNLENWITESSHFPRLITLVLRGCLSLKEVPNGVGRIPTLEFIELDDQNHSVLLSAKHIQEDRQSLGYDPLHIRAV